RFELPKKWRTPPSSSWSATAATATCRQESSRREHPTPAGGVGGDAGQATDRRRPGDRGGVVVFGARFLRQAPVAGVSAADGDLGALLHSCRHHGGPAVAAHGLAARGHAAPGPAACARRGARAVDAVL